MNYETITYNNHKIYKVKVDLDIESILKEISIDEEYATITYSTDAFTGKHTRQMYQDCYDALKKVYEIELNKPIIIMEDDAIVSRDFTKHINNVMNNLVPKEWDIIQLNYNWW